MKRNLISILTVILCLSLMFAAGMTAMATGTDGEGAESSSSQTVAGEPSSSVESSSFDESSDETDSSSSEERSSSENTNGENSDEQSSEESSDKEGSEDGESSEDGGSSEEDTSSESTSSRKPIYSNGAGGGSTFIDETGSQIAQGNSSTSTDVPGTSSGTSSTNEISPEDEHYEGDATSFSDKIYKVMWIPIVIAVLCIAALITVNIMFQKGYNQKAKNGASRRNSSSAAQRPQRRK